MAHAHNSIHHSMAGPDQRGLRTKLTVIKMKLVRKGVIIPSKRPAALVPGLLVTSVVSVTPMLHVQITILRTGEAGSFVVLCGVCEVRRPAEILARNRSECSLFGF